MRDGNAPHMARWVAEEGYQLTGWEPDLSSQTGEPGGDPARVERGHPGISLGREGDREGDDLLGPADCAEIERRHASDKGLLLNGGSSRGNLLGAGGRGDPHREPDRGRETREPGLPDVLCERLQRHAGARAVRLGADHRVGRRSAGETARRPAARTQGRDLSAPRAGMCVVVRDLIVQAVLTDMMKGRPAIYATFSSYDEVAYHSGLERADTLEALRKLDHQFGRIERARRYAPRPYEIVVPPTTVRPRARVQAANGHGLDELVRSRSRRATSHPSRAVTRTTPPSAPPSARRPAASPSRSGRRTTSRERRSLCWRRATSASST